MITPYRPDDPLELAADYVRTQAEDTVNYSGAAITALFRLFMWLLIWFCLAGARRINLLDTKWVERRNRSAVDAEN